MELDESLYGGGNIIARDSFESEKELLGGCGQEECRVPTSGDADPVTSDLYDETQLAAIPIEAKLASLGCGNPTALAELKPGEVVLDLGSGGGIDVLLSAKRVGASGKPTDWT